MKAKTKTESRRKKRPRVESIAIRTVVMLTLERQTMRNALGDLLALYDRVANSSGGHGWTASDVKRLEEIRELAKG